MLSRRQVGRSQFANSGSMVHSENVHLSSEDDFDSDDLSVDSPIELGSDSIGFDMSAQEETDPMEKYKI